jgi:hypothetical protein
MKDHFNKLILDKKKKKLTSQKQPNTKEAPI